MSKPVMELNRLDGFTFREAVELWNEGFKGYFTEMNRTLSRHLEYFGATGVRPELSVVAVVDGKPAGFVLTALRTIGGRKTAWNAGTGVAPPYRRMGVGKAMMNEAIHIYREQEVHTAFLEAIYENHNAVALYGSCGFQSKERLFCYSRKGPSNSPLFGAPNRNVYRVVQASPREAGELAYYRSQTAWCSQWPNVNEAMFVRDEEDAVAGYALLRRSFNEDGKLTEIKLLQLEADPGRIDGVDAAKFLLAELYGSDASDITRSAENIPVSSTIVTRLLQEAGFETRLDQHLMVLDL